jgi:hypothetical protein
MIVRVFLGLMFAGRPPRENYQRATVRDFAGSLIVCQAVSICLLQRNLTSDPKSARATPAFLVPSTEQ